MLNHVGDLGFEAESHFVTTSHGKGACVGIGGCVKRNAYRASLQGRNATGITNTKNCMSGQRISSNKIPLRCALLLNKSNTRKN